MTDARLAALEPPMQRFDTPMTALDLRTRLMLVALGVVPLDLGFTGAFIAVSGQWEITGHVVGLNLVILGLINMAGAWWILRPLGWLQAPDAPEKRRSARRRLRALPFLLPLWAFVLGAVYCSAIFLTGPYVEEGATLLSPLLGFTAFLWFTAIYGFYFAFYVYFAASDALSGARERREVPPVSSTPQPMAWKLLLVAFALAVMPTAQILQDLTWLAPVRTAQGLTALQAVVLDLTATSIAAVLSLYFVGRSLLRPLAALNQGLEQIGAGRFSTRLIPHSDDEMGEVAHHFNRMAHGLAERERVEGMFAKYVAPPVAKSLLSDSRNGQADTKRRIATNLFADIAGFTSLSENMDAADAIAMLNDYFDAVSAPISAQGGVIVNLTGDGLHAVFNLPIEREDHAAAAVRAAEEITEILSHRRFGPDLILKTRIGIHTGAVVAGSVGSDERLHYTVYGDCVNAASRLEALNKELDTRVLISDATLSAMGSEAATFDLQTFANVPIRGRAQPMTVHALQLEAQQTA